MAAPLIHVDGALTICARAHSLNTAGPTLAEERTRYRGSGAG